MKKYGFWIFFFVLYCTGCSPVSVTTATDTLTYYDANLNSANAIATLAPFFRVFAADQEHNRIGSPHITAAEDETITINTRQPVVYHQTKSFSTAKDSYTNYLYRVHFPEVPFSLVPFYLTAGSNVGLIVVITVNSQNIPVLITTVHTCGCYLAFTPTTALDRAALPADWPETGIVSVYGEKLPAVVDYTSPATEKVLVSIRPDVHRVMDIEIMPLPLAHDSNTAAAQLRPIEELNHLPKPGGTTSFYYDTPFLRGHVKGSVKIWESLLLSLVSMDLFVGTEKVYGDRTQTGNTFYTSLKPWNRLASDMWHFENFLKFWGWKL